MVFPIPQDRVLSLRTIADYWSREVQPPATKQETLTELIEAWWRAEFVGNGKPNRIMVLRWLYQNCQDCIVFTVPGLETLPQIDGTEDGGVSGWPDVSLPNLEPDSWDETNCAQAFEALALEWFLLNDKVYESMICVTQLDRAEFYGWLAKRGNWLPVFWAGASAPARIGTKPLKQWESEGLLGDSEAPASTANLEMAGEQSMERAPSARKTRHGPARGAVDRFGKSDRALFPQMKRIMRTGPKTAYAAALELASAKKIMGTGTSESRAKRLVRRFLKENAPRATH
jgi:hypothetical protein